jgi:anti-sigma factor RsiW
MMSNILQQLENDQAVLLMYLAGELPELDRAEVEQRLVNEPDLRAAMAQLAALHDDVGAALGREDARHTLAPSRRESAVRNVVRAMTAARQARIEASPPVAAAEDARRRFHIAWWAYPAALAACLVVAITLMANRAPDRLGPAPEVERLNELQASVPPPRIFDQTEDPALDRLDSVEQQVLSLHTPENGLFEVDTIEIDR